MKRIIKCDRKNIEVIVHGNEQNDHTFLFFHSFGASAAIVPDEAAWYNENNICLIAFNRPGIGNSEYLQQFTAKDIAAIAATLLSVLHKNKATVIGWSGGAIYAMQFAHLYPTLCSQLILLSPTLPLIKGLRSKAPFLLQTIRRMSYASPFLLKRFFRKKAIQMQHHFAEEWQKAVAKMPVADNKLVNDEIYADSFIKASKDCWLHNGMGMHADAKAIVQAKGFHPQQLHLPVTIWQGTADAVCKAKHVLYLAECFPQGSYKECNKEGHFLLLNYWKHILTTAVTIPVPFQMKD